MSKEEGQLRTRTDRQSSAREHDWRVGDDLSFDGELARTSDTDFTAADLDVDYASQIYGKRSKSVSTSTLNGNSDAEIFERCRFSLCRISHQLEALALSENAIESDLLESLRGIDVQLRVVKSRCDLLDDRLNDAIETQRRDLELLKSELRSVQEHIEDELKERSNELRELRLAAGARMDRIIESAKMDRRAPPEPLRALAEHVHARLGGSLWRSLIDNRLRCLGFVLLFLLSISLMACSTCLDFFTIGSYARSTTSSELQVDAVAQAQAQAEPI